MASELTPWAAILVIASVTFLNRIAGPIMMKHIETSAKVERFLDAMSVSVVAALVASILAQGGWREVIAVGISAMVMMRFTSAVWAMVAGIGAAAVWFGVFS
ncbi:AzlD domain-containing protein [Ruegeria sp.]|uniref:AzlD domain-containing protein n=1 Tax=Ruegeria sp. TaxID=1879320 RepID=UPI0023175730|nr:AzlD domain-containing protein [Ruegeria sp.]MDA7963560.1 AzlD domain-containing protein [Ruegeria sp.]